MRILYGVTGEGMGHATRSKVVCEHLLAQGHKVIAAVDSGEMWKTDFCDASACAGVTGIVCVKFFWGSRFVCHEAFWGYAGFSLVRA